MRTHSGNTDKPGTSCGCANMTDPPLAPPLADTVVALMNVSADNACLLQALVQNGMPVPQGHLEPATHNTYDGFLKTHPPVFLKAEEHLEADDWIRTIE